MFKVGLKEEKGGGQRKSKITPNCELMFDQEVNEEIKGDLERKTFLTLTLLHNNESGARTGRTNL